MNDAIVTLVFLFGLSLSASIGFGAAWFRSSRRVRQLEDQLFAARRPDGRVEELERSLDTLAGQIEQLANGQEFLNRVVSGRGDRLPASSAMPEHDITPH